jgi:hypothetical protein
VTNTRTFTDCDRGGRSVFRLRLVRRRVLVALLAAVGVAFVACGPDPGPQGVGVLNSTAETIRITYVVDGVEQAVKEDVADTVDVSRTTTFRLDLFDPGNSENCTTGDIVVRSLDGQELDRFPPPVCDGRVLRALDRRSSVN